MQGDLAAQYKNVHERIINLADHCSFHKGDKDAKVTLKRLKILRKVLVGAMRKHSDKYEKILSKCRVK